MRTCGAEAEIYRYLRRWVKKGTEMRLPLGLNDLLLIAFSLTQVVSSVLHVRASFANVWRQ